MIFWIKFAQKWHLRSKLEKVNITSEFCIFKLEENNNLGGGDVLVYLAKPMHKKCSITFVWGHPFSTYVRACVCVCVCVSVCVYVCLYVCVCVFVCLYSSTVKASSDCKMFKTYLRGSDQRSCVVNIYLGASAKFIHLHFQIYRISPRTT